MKDQVYISAAPHPFRQARVDLYAPEGLSISEMLMLHHIRTDIGRTRIFINDEYIPKEMWPRIRPKATAMLTVCITPEGGGGGGKNPLRTVLSIAVLVAGNFVAGAFATNLALGIFGGGVATTGQVAFTSALITGAIGIAGNLLINAIAPPPKPKLNALSSIGSNAKDSPTLFIEGARNDLRPFGVTPCALGHHRFVPPLGAQNYSETIGNQQYVRQIFLWGYGPVDIPYLESSLKIGDTPLSDFDDVEFETIYAENSAPDISLYPFSVSQIDLSIKLTEEGGYQLRTTDDETDEIIIDLTFPQGLAKFDNQGKKRSKSVTVEFEYAPQGTSNWTSIETRTFNRATTAAIRESIRKTVSRGQYDVRLRRITADTNSTQIFDDVFWTSLRSIRNESPIAEENLVVTAVRMRATDQLNGAIDTLSGELKRICLDWDSGTSSWILRATNNPASLFRWILQGPANHRPLPDSRIDLEALQAWHVFCEENEFSFNAVIDYESAVKEVLSDITSAGRASPTIIDGKWSVVVDQEKTIPVQHFTPRNSWGYQGEKSFPDIAHAFRVQFLNEEQDWHQDERIVYDDGYDEDNATKYETLELFGITSPEQVYKHAREHIASVRLRPETHSFYVDIENLVATRGDLIRFSHDVPLVGLKTGRVKSLITDPQDPSMVTQLVLDEWVEMAEGQLYSCRFRLSDGTSTVHNVKTDLSKTNTLTFVTAISISEAAEAGDLFMFGERQRETIELVIRSIEAGSDLSARLRCVNAAPEIFQASKGSIPPFNSFITAPPEFARPKAPIIEKIQTGEEVQIVNLDGSIGTRMVVTLKNQNLGPVEPIVRIRQIEEDDYHDADILSRTSEKIVLENLENGQIYDLKIFYRRLGSSLASNSLISTPALVNGLTFQGITEPPSDVENFNITVRGETVYLSWDRVKAIDLSHYEIRYSKDTLTPSWSSSVPLFPLPDKTSTGTSYPSAIGSYLIKAVDRGDRKSTNAAIVITTIGSLANLNVVETIDEHDAWGGTHNATRIDQDVLKLGSLQPIDEWGSVDDIVLWDMGYDRLLESEGIYNFAEYLDLGAVYTSVLSAALEVTGSNELDRIDVWSAIDERENWDGADPSKFNVILEVRTTQDNPSNSPAWTPWQPLTIGEYTARAFEFRLVLISLETNVTPSVSQVSVTIDMEDRVQSGDDITVPSEGSTIQFETPFRALKGLSLSIDNLRNDERYEIPPELKTASGFFIRFFDANDNGISRTCSYLAKGYGKQS